MAEAKQLALLIAKERGLIYVNGYDHPNIIAGQGTIGLEICEQVPYPDAVVVPVGGGGLIAGVATAIKAMSPKTKIIVSLTLFAVISILIAYMYFDVRALNRRNAQAFQMPWNMVNPSRRALNQH